MLKRKLNGLNAPQISVESSAVEIFRVGGNPWCRTKHLNILALKPRYREALVSGEFTS
jgi:hypothetical protein